MKNQTLYIAEMCDAYGAEKACKNGIGPDNSGIITLSTSENGAIIRLLYEAAAFGHRDPTKIKTLYLFPVELPEGAPAEEERDTPDEIKEYSYVRYKGTLPGKYIKGSAVVDLFDPEPEPGKPVYNTTTMYFAVREGDVEKVLKNGFTFHEVAPDGSDGIILTSTLEEAVALYALLYRTKENGIKSLAVFGVKFPPFVQLAIDQDINIYPGRDPIRCFGYKGKIPPEYITGYSVIDLKPGGLFA